MCSSQDIVAYGGQSCPVEFFLKNDDGTPIDVTGPGWRFEFVAEQDGANVLYADTEPDGGLEIGDDSYVRYAGFAATTENMGAVEAEYQLFAFEAYGDPDGRNYPMCTGTVKLKYRFKKPSA